LLFGGIRNGGSKYGFLYHYFTQRMTFAGESPSPRLACEKAIGADAMLTGLQGSKKPGSSNDIPSFFLGCTRSPNYLKLASVIHSPTQ
jgi:hypothetical protein